MKKTRTITEAGLCVAIYTIFFILSRYLGGELESIFFFILPIPLVVFTVRHGISFVIIPIVSICLFCFLINPLSLFYVGGASVLGAFYGWFVKRRKNSKSLIVLSFVVSLVTNLLAMVIFAKLLGYSLKEDVFSLFDVIFRMFNLDSLNQIILDRIAIIASPVFIGVGSLLEGYAVHVFSTIILKKLKICDYGIGNIFLLEIPKCIGIFYIFCGLAHIFTLGILYSEEINIFTIISIIIAILFWLSALFLSLETLVTIPLYFRYNKYNKIIIIILILLLFVFTPIVIFLYSIIGVIIIFNDIHSYLLYNNK